MSQKTVVLIDDEHDVFLLTQSELVGKATVKWYETIEDFLDRFSGTADLIVIDISAVHALISLQSNTAQFASPIAMVCDRHPGTWVLIRSALPRDMVNKVVEDVKRYVPESLIQVVGFDEPLTNYL